MSLPSAASPSSTAIGGRATQDAHGRALTGGLAGLGILVEALQSLRNDAHGRPVTAVAVGSIALGIGANAALLGAVALGASLLPALRASRRWWRCATNETRAGSARERRLRPLRAEA